MAWGGTSVSSPCTRQDMVRIWDCMKSINVKKVAELGLARLRDKLHVA